MSPAQDEGSSSPATLLYLECIARSREERGAKADLIRTRELRLQVHNRSWKENDFIRIALI
jgi:hypothetical protein